MKLTEILKESSDNQALLHWLTTYLDDCFWVSPEGETDYSSNDIYEILMKEKKVDSSSDDGYFYIDFNFNGNEVVECPVPSEKWLDIFDDTIRRCTYMNATIKDPEKLLDVADELHLEICTVESFKFPKGTYLETLWMKHCEVKDNCGMLSLLKTESIGTCRCSGCGEKIEKAVAIVAKHLADKQDVAECMDELIEAGLKEFAKS
jgi:hypothetical protein